MKRPLLALLLGILAWPLDGNVPGITSAPLRPASEAVEWVVMNPESAWAPVFDEPHNRTGRILGYARNADRVEILEESGWPFPHIVNWLRVRFVSGACQRGVGWIPRKQVREHGVTHLADAEGHTLTLSGDEDFRSALIASLDDLHERLPREHAFVIGRLRRITQAARSRVNANSGELTLSRDAVDSSRAYLSGALAHEAMHCATFSLRLWQADPTQVELVAVRHQLDVLRALGASPDEVEHVAGQDGKHWDLDGDGVPSWMDIELQDW